MRSVGTPLAPNGRCAMHALRLICSGPAKLYIEVPLVGCITICEIVLEACLCSAAA
jgi:hypothetical protein